MDEVTGVYRILVESASHSKNIKVKEQFIQETYKIIYYFATLYNKGHLYNENEKWRCLFENAVLYGDFSKEKIYFKKLKKKSLLHWIKHLLCKNKHK